MHCIRFSLIQSNLILTLFIVKLKYLLLVQFSLLVVESAIPICHWLQIHTSLSNSSHFLIWVDYCRCIQNVLSSYNQPCDGPEHEFSTVLIPVVWKQNVPLR